jgi:hypothetical protein
VLHSVFVSILQGTQAIAIPFFQGMWPTDSSNPDPIDCCSAPSYHKKLFISTLIVQPQIKSCTTRSMPSATYAVNCLKLHQSNYISACKESQSRVALDGKIRSHASQTSQTQSLSFTAAADDYLRSRPIAQFATQLLERKWHHSG